MKNEKNKKEIEQGEFQKARLLQECLKWVKVMKMVNPAAWRLINAHWLDNVPIEHTYDGEFTTMVLPSNEILEKIYGKTEIIFKGDSTRQTDIIDVHPKEYLKKCFYGQPVVIHDMFVPNDPKEIFKVKTIYRQLHK